MLRVREGTRVSARGGNGVVVGRARAKNRERERTIQAELEVGGAMFGRALTWLKDYVQCEPLAWGKKKTRRSGGAKYVRCLKRYLCAMALDHICPRSSEERDVNGNALIRMISFI